MIVPHRFKLIPISFLIAAFASSAHAQWSAHGTAVSIEANSQIDAQVIPDGSGGAFLVWEDNRVYSSFDIYAQRVDADGNALWGVDGLPICLAAGNQDGPQIVSDGAGGVIITWYDYRNGSDYDIYAQRVDGSGTALWTADGIVISAMSNHQRDPQLIPDGSGGAYIAWHDARNGADYDIYAQRVDASGTALWTANGVVICGLAGTQAEVDMASDSAGGAIISWYDFRSGIDYDIYAQRVDGSGTALWSSQGVAVCTYSSDQYRHRVAADGMGGALITWEDYRNSTGDIYAMRLNGDGNALWTANGVCVCSYSNAQYNPEIAPDGSGGAIVAWYDYRNSTDYDIYAQRVTAAGTTMWENGGVQVCGAAENQYLPQIVPLGSGSCILAWYDYRGSNSDVYAQRLNGSGQSLWTDDGIAISTAPYNQADVKLASDDAGGIILVWEDSKGGVWDIYAQRIEDRHGYWGHPEPVLASVSDVSEDQGGYVEIEWDACGRDTYEAPDMIGYSIWRSTSSAPKNSDSILLIDDLSVIGPEFRGPAFRIESNKAGEYHWEWVGFQTAHHFPGYSFTAPTRHDSTGIDPGTHYFQVVAHVADQHIWWASDVVSGYSIDNLAPGAPAMLLGKRDGCDVTLDWEPSVENAEDLRGYRIYRDIESGFEPTDGLLIGTAIDTAFVDTDPVHDARSYYVVTALDIHGNEGSPSNEVSMTPSTGLPESPGAFRLVGNMPNPFNPTTRIEYEIPRGAPDSRVLLRIYETAGRLVRTLVDAPQSPGPHGAIWDGTNDAGEAVGSGVYSYRLEWNGDSETGRMVLVR